jgi:hypothetical protein
MSALLLLVLTAHPGPSERPCGSCHREAATSFAGSAHAHAFTNPLFQASWQNVRRRTWCLSCHAQEGMACEACHERLDAKVTDAACERCHQFHAPEDRYREVPMQDTFGEWRRAGGTKSCVGCHFPQGDHRSPGGHDLALVRSALGLKWVKRCATLEAREVGHAVPTGDPFHFLRLVLCADAACTQRLEAKPLSRTFKTDPDGKVRVAADTRARPSHSQTLCFAPSAATHWVLELRHAELAIDAQAPDDERWRIVLTGELPAP